MAQIDLKNCDIFLEDGYAGPSGTWLVNLMAGYMAGAVTMLVDGGASAAVIGDRFEVAGDTGVVHVVTAHSETLGITTSITFTPALGASVSDDAAITWLDHQLKIKIGEGTAQWTEKRPITYTKDRGRLDTVKLGDEDPIEVKLDFTWVFLKGDTSDPPTIEDVLKQRGNASTWVSSSSDQCEPYAINIIIVYTPPCPAKKEIYNLHDFRYEDLGHDIKTGMVSVTGKCNVTEPVVTRATTYP
jgi:hypothetical protein